MRFADDSRERGWNRSTKVAAPAAVPETIDAPMDRSQSRRSRRQSQRTTAGRLLHPIYTVKQRLIGASYRNGRRDFKHLFKFYDRDNSGMISEEEFVSLMRRDGKIKPKDMSDRMLREIFREVDGDGNGEVSHEEFEAWVTAPQVLDEEERAERRIGRIDGDRRRSYTNPSQDPNEVFDRLSKPEGFLGPPQHCK